METHNYSYNKHLQPNANILRREMTKAEACLWKYALRANKLGVPFKRQRPVYKYIADFVCLPLKLVIEVDGFSHQLEDIMQKDKQKENDLRALGYEIIRFSDDEVLKDINNVIRVIEYKIEEQKRISTP
jgi:very-short-patch-repair endonuclease